MLPTQSTWGVLLRFFNLTQPTMKVLLFVALAIAAVVAEPEAEALANPDAEAAADAWHGYYGYVADGADTMVDTMATLTDTDTTEARGLPHLKLKPKLPL